MRFLVDEGADARLASHLNNLGHDAKTIARDYTRALDDVQVLALAQSEGRILITDDRDFGELVFRFRQPHTGVILLRLHTTALAVKIARLDYVLERFAHRLDEFVVVTERGVRIGGAVKE